MNALLIFLTVILILVLLCVVAAVFLYEFSLSPTFRFSMSRLLRTGKVKEINTEGFSLKSPQTLVANEFFDAQAKSISVKADDGKELFGWLICPQAPDTCAIETDAESASPIKTIHLGGEAINTDVLGDKWVVMCHGYCSNPKEMSRFALHFHNLGFTVVLPAARGHERNISTGAIQMGWQDSEDLLKWIGFVLSVNPAARIALFGISMGGAEVMMASGRNLPDQVKVIVEDCGYTGVWDEFKDRLNHMFHLPAFPIMYMVNGLCRRRAGYDLAVASTLDMLKRTQVPLLFIHGTADNFVPFSMLDGCFSACASPHKHKLAIKGAGHGESAFKEPNLYWSEVDGFIEQHL